MHYTIYKLTLTKKKGKHSSDSCLFVLQNKYSSKLIGKINS